MLTNTPSNSPAGSVAQDAATTPGGARPRCNVEVMILAHNEAANLPHSLASVIGWADAVYVVDSGSNDGSQEIASRMGAQVVHRPWLGYARQKNWALEHLPFKSDWIFILDADESITPELKDELLAIAGRPAEQAPIAGYYVNRLTFFMGAPIRHAGYYPSYNLRFFRRGKARYEDREVHEHMVVDGPTERLKREMLHEDRRGLEHFIAKHNRYSTLEARELMREQIRRSRGDRATHLERGIATRRWLKNKVLPRLPFSGVWRFLYMYILRLGILDGLPGFRFCLLLATYDTFISLKLAELRAMGAEEKPELMEAPSTKARGLAVPEGELAVAATGAAKGPSVEPAAVAAPAPFVPKSAPVVPALEPKPAAAPAASGAETESPEGRPLPDPIHPQTARHRAELANLAFPPGKWPAKGSVPVSVLIPVKNEQRNIVDCIRHCMWASEIVVVDSQSTDQTIPMSQALGADVYQFYYSKEGWPKKKNWALEQVPWKNEWVLILDADEFMTPELTEEVRQVVTGAYTPKDPKKAGCGDGYWLNRRFMFMGRWIRGCGYYPSWNVRLFKHRVGRYERIGTLGQTGSGDNEVHEHVVLSTGPAGYLEHEFLHYAYPDLTAWIEKHNRYTTWEAHAMKAKDAGAVQASLFGGPIERRRWLKRFARGLPFRPTLRFLFSYLIQLGIRDGYPGYVMCRLLAWYEFVSLAKYYEMETQQGEAARRDAQQTSGKPLG
ncbi:MAG TPA: glycosyltransferase family 2 protein [Phycisphaerales bacterium]|nr:glycosyltransferase family 2 protein [Phycisphaerales bacterium]